jgi:hypothetical protein
MATKKKTKKKLPKKKANPKTKSSKKPAGKKKPARKKARVLPRKVRGNDSNPAAVADPREKLGKRTDELSGDLEGLSDVESADSESVDELLEEGNAFEAEAVKGVQDADDADEREVHTHEVPEDDVPEEYLDKE